MRCTGLLMHIDDLTILHKCLPDNSAKFLCYALYPRSPWCSPLSLLCLPCCLVSTHTLCACTLGAVAQTHPVHISHRSGHDALPCKSLDISTTRFSPSRNALHKYAHARNMCAGQTTTPCPRSLWTSLPPLPAIWQQSGGPCRKSAKL
jgi:hypothetical protein